MGLDTCGAELRMAGLHLQKEATEASRHSPTTLVEPSHSTERRQAAALQVNTF